MTELTKDQKIQLYEHKAMLALATKTLENAQLTHSLQQTNLQAFILGIMAELKLPPSEWKFDFDTSQFLPLKKDE